MDGYFNILPGVSLMYPCHVHPTFATNLVDPMTVPSLEGPTVPSLQPEFRLIVNMRAKKNLECVQSKWFKERESFAITSTSRPQLPAKLSFDGQMTREDPPLLLLDRVSDISTEGEP